MEFIPSKLPIFFSAHVSGVIQWADGAARTRATGHIFGTAPVQEAHQKPWNMPPTMATVKVTSGATGIRHQTLIIVRPNQRRLQFEICGRQPALILYCIRSDV